MNHILSILADHGIGKTPVTEDDLWRIAAKENVEVVLSKRKYPFYFTVPCDNLNIIVIPDRLCGMRFMFTFAHELLGHHLLHGGDEPCIAFSGRSDNKYEFEADAAALLALMPKPIESLPELSKHAQKLCRERQKLYFLYGV